MRRGSSAIRITGHSAQSQQLRPRCHQRTSSPPCCTTLRMAAALFLLGGVGNILQQMNLKEASRPIYLGEPAISIAPGAPRTKSIREILSSTQCRRS